MKESNGSEAGRNGIVLAMFGTSSKEGLQALLSIQARVEEALPRAIVKMSFTSGIIREIWRKREHDSFFRKENPHIPDTVFHIKGAQTAIAELQERGCREIIVQSVHVAPAEEFMGLAGVLEALTTVRVTQEKNRPFHKLALGRPLFGAPARGGEACRQDVMSVAKSLSNDINLARSKRAAMVYMGHGNSTFSSGSYYLEFASAMKTLYPDVVTVVGTMEGVPSLDKVVGRLKEAGITKALLKPLLVVAGRHAVRDMIGEGPDSWRSVLVKQGIEVVPILRGLGEEQGIVKIFIEHIMDAAAEAGILLEKGRF